MFGKGYNMKLLKKFSFETIVINCISSFLITSLLFIFINPDSYLNISYVNNIKIQNIILIFLFIYFFISLIHTITTSVSYKYYVLGVSFFLYTIVIAFQSQNNYLLCMGLSIPAFILFFYIFSKKGRNNKKDSSLNFSITQIRNLIIICYVFAMLLIILGNYYSYTTGCDTGIYNQTMYNLSHSGAPFYTLDAGGHDRQGYKLMGEMVNQMKVHFTPFIFLLFPIYYCFQSPVTLLLFQIIVIALAVIPLYKIAEICNIPNNFKHILAITYLLNPVVLGCQFFEFHEYCLLPLALLWLIYFMLKQSWKGTLIALFGVLIIKEDTPIYIISIMLYFLFKNVTQDRNFKKIILPLICILIAGLYFVIVVFFYLDGGGSFTYRYSELMLSESRGFIDILIVLLKNPGYIFKQIFTYDKMIFLFCIIIPLGGIPLLALTDIYQVFLLVPLVLLNLLPTEFVQYSVQYYFGIGSTIFCIYIVILNYAKIRSKKLKRILPYMMTYMSLVLTVGSHSDFLKTSSYIIAKNDDISKINETISEIPDDGVVITSNAFSPQLSSRKNIYLFGLGYAEGEDIHSVINRDNFQTDDIYILIDLRSYSSKLWWNQYTNAGYIEYINEFFESSPYNYEIIDYQKNVCILLKEASESSIQNEEILDTILKNDIASENN